MHAGSLLVPVGVAAIGAAFVLLRRRQLHADTPTSQCIGVFIGWNEVKGAAWHEQPSTSHFTRLECVRWTARILEENRRSRTVTSTDAQGRTHTRTETYYTWDEIESWGDSVGPFYVVDHSGAVLVDPERATVQDRSVVDRIVGDRAGGWFVGNGPTGRRRELEAVIAVGDLLYVTGGARLRDDVVAPIIDSDEGGPFVISTRPEERVTSTWRFGGWLLLIAGLVACTAGSNFALGSFGVDGRERSALAALPGAVVGAVTAVIGGLILLYNGHVRVANRARRAWSLIDVMLARRHELVPLLVAVVAGARDHEGTLQAALAELRDPAHLDARDASTVATAQTELLRAVIARAETYPELQIDANFVALQQRLSDVEDRIAAARSFYNDSVNHLRDRLGTFPGVLVARYVRGRDVGLFAAEGFERVVPEGLFPTLRAEP
jgi:hypothetical protein